MSLQRSTLIHERSWVSFALRRWGAGVDSIGVYKKLMEAKTPRPAVFVGERPLLLLSTKALPFSCVEVCWCSNGQHISRLNSNSCPFWLRKINSLVRQLTCSKHLPDMAREDCQLNTVQKQELLRADQSNTQVGLLSLSSFQRQRKYALWLFIGQHEQTKQQNEDGHCTIS